MSPPLQPVSGLIAPEHRQLIAELGGSHGMSHGLRLAVEAGLAALADQPAPLLSAVDDLQQLTNDLARITGRRTPSGAWWAPTEAAAPGIEQLDPVGDVVVTPHGVCLLSGAAALSVDLQAGQLAAVHAGQDVIKQIDVQALAPVVALIAPALIGLATAGPGRCGLGHGLLVERLGNDEVQLMLDGIGPVMPCAVAWQWCAEMTSLLCRGLGRSVGQRQQLERQLEVSA